MSVKIVTDSTSDISADLASSLGIEVVPGYIRFGQDTYRDGVDISKPEFYQKLTDSPKICSLTKRWVEPCILLSAQGFLQAEAKMYREFIGIC